MVGLDASMQFVARLVGGKPPKRVPRSVVRLAGGPWGVAYLTRLVGADNHRAREELGWRPLHPSWRSGMVVGSGHEAVTRTAGAHQ